MRSIRRWAVAALFAGALACAVAAPPMGKKGKVQRFKLNKLARTPRQELARMAREDPELAKKLAAAGGLAAAAPIDEALLGEDRREDRGLLEARRAHRRRAREQRFVAAALDDRLPAAARDHAELRPRGRRHRARLRALWGG